MVKVIASDQDEKTKELLRLRYLTSCKSSWTLALTSIVILTITLRPNSYSYLNT